MLGVLDISACRESLATIQNEESSEGRYKHPEPIFVSNYKQSLP